MLLQNNSSNKMEAKNAGNVPSVNVKNNSSYTVKLF